MKAVDTEKLFATTDAQVWAQEFMKVVESGSVVDEGLMIGWFANAIETAKSLERPRPESTVTEFVNRLLLRTIRCRRCGGWSYRLRFDPRGCRVCADGGDLMAQAESDDRVLLARTWNDNPSGRLWEALWFRSGGRYYRDVDAPGVFVPAHEFPNEATFWADFEDERAKFHGMRAGDSRD